MLNRFLTKRGFTLIELSVVMLIIALLAAIAIPGLNGFYGRYKLQLAALQLQQEIRTLGQASLQREWAGYQITFAVTQDYYTVKGPEGSKKVAMPPGIDLLKIDFGTPGEDQMKFTARGVSLQSGSIAFRDRVSGHFKYVIVTPVTGRTRISDIPPDNDEN